VPSAKLAGEVSVPRVLLSGDPITLRNFFLDQQP
jgi:hypothetical protein